MSESRRVDLRAIDDRYLPRAARRLHALLAWAAGVGGSAAAGARTGFDVLRTRPQVSAPLLVAAVVAGVAVAVLGHHDSAAPQHSSVVPPGGFNYTTLGPAPGQPVSQYLQQARTRLSQVAKGGPDATTVAIVDLTGYRTPQDVIRLFTGEKVTQVHFRARVPGVTTRPHVAAVSGTDQVPSVLDRSGQVEASTAASLLRYAGTLPTTAPALTQQRNLLLQQAEVARAESVRLTATCPCVFAVVVQAPVRQLQAVAARPGVRLVDPAPAGSAPGSVGFVPLAPEVTTTVPQSAPLP